MVCVFLYYYYYNKRTRGRIISAKIRKYICLVIILDIEASTPNTDAQSKNTKN
jgi:hypothetical protein